MKALRLRWWLWWLDVIAAWGGFGTPLYCWLLRKSANCVDWGSLEFTGVSVHDGDWVGIVGKPEYQGEPE